MKNILLFTFVISIMSACASTNSTRGNFIHAEDIGAITPYITTQFEVLNLLGTPTAKAVFDQNTWYYVGLKTEKKGFFDETITDRQVYKITFDDNDIVQSMVEVENDSVDVPLASRVTPTSGNDVTFLQQMLGNIGKFNPPAQ